MGSKDWFIKRIQNFLYPKQTIFIYEITTNNILIHLKSLSFCNPLYHDDYKQTLTKLTFTNTK